MRYFKTTIIAVICLAVAVAAIFAVKFLLPDDTEKSSAPTEETKVSLFDIDSKKIVKIESKYEELFSLYFADGKWNSLSHTDLLIYDNSVEDFIGDFTNLTGYVIKDFEKLSDFGITENSYYTKIVLDDGTSYALKFGIEDAQTSLRYAVIEGAEDTVYSISSYSASNVMMTRNHLVRLEAFSFSDGYHPSYFSMKKDGKRVMSASAVYKAAQTEGEKDSTTWTILEPIEIAAENDDFNNLVKSLKDVALSELYDGKCEDLADYGLDKPIIEYSIVYKNDEDKKETMSIALGSKTNDATHYYCIINGDSTSVYTINASYIMVDITLEDYIDGKVFYDMYTELKTVTFYFEGEEHTMKYVFGAENKEERFFDGVFVHNEESYRDENLDTPENKFNHLLASIYLISITTVDPEEPAEKGELLFKVVYNKIDGTTVTVECFERDETTAYLYKNGEYFGGYMKTAVILYGDYEDYGIKGSLVAVKEAMK